MKESVKRKWKSFSTYAIVFGTACLISFVFLSTLCNCLRKFDILNTSLCYIISGTGSAVFSVICMIALYFYFQNKKESKIGFWLSMNYPKLILLFVIINLILVSVSEKNIWTAEEIIDVMAIEWTIFGLSVTIFLVWNVLIVNYLKDKKPKQPDEADLVQKYELLVNKRQHYQDTNTMFNTISLLTINLLILLFATCFVYIIHIPESLFTQNLVLCSFYFTTNTIVGLFFDILTPLKNSKKDLLAEDKINKNQLDEAYAGARIQQIIEDVINIIKANTEFSEQQKNELTLAFFKSLKNEFVDNDAETNQTNKSSEE